MSQGPLVKGNPLRLTVYMLVLGYLIGEFVFPKYPLLYFFNLMGILGLIMSLFFFFSGFNIFKSYNKFKSDFSNKYGLESFIRFISSYKEVIP